MNRIFLTLLFGMLALCAPVSGVAGDNPVGINIYGPGQNRTNVAMTTPIADQGTELPSSALELDKLIRHNLGFLPFLSFVNESAILGGNRPDTYKMPGIDFKRYQLANTDILIVTGWPAEVTERGRRVELRVYETGQGSLLVGKAYYLTPKVTLPMVAEKFASDFMQALTGRGDFFRSTLAFVSQKKAGQKDIWIVKPTGGGLRQVTNAKGIALSPSWSADGRHIIFSHIGERSHALGVWSRVAGNTQLIRFPGNTVIGPRFLPDNTVAVSLAASGNPDIFLLNHLFKRKKILEQSWGIDVSPTLDASGKKMAFVSNRMGNPHVFLKDLETGRVTRVSRDGKYNTSPSISSDGTLVVFSRRTSAGHRIFVHDLVTGREAQVTFGPGNDEMPSFAPDNYFIAFASNRTGRYKVYLTTRHGGEPKMVDTGKQDASFPAWGHVSD